MTLKVDQPSAAVCEMAKQWHVVDALMGGTPAMRAAGKTYLPQWPNEEDDSYEARLKVATLFPAYERTVSVMAGKPFAKALTLSDDTPDQIRTWAEDIDLQGVNLHTFASEMFYQGIGWGYGGILVDAPKPTRKVSGRPSTRKEQQEQGVRPYWSRIRHDQILGWRTTKGSGPKKLTMLRIIEADTEDDGDYGELAIFRIRVLRPGSYELWEARADRRAKGGTSYKEVESGTTGVNEITFAPVYGVKTGFMTARPPMQNLAYLNVEHWQSKSDQQNILHFARVPILFGRQLGDSSIVIGAATAVKGDFEKSDLKFVEHTGASIGAGRQSMLDLEEEMIQSGAELLVKKPGQRSATESANDAEANKSDLQRHGESFEDTLDLSLYFTALYSSQKKGGKATLFKDYGAANLTEASGQLVNDMQSRGLIRRVTAVKEQQRRGILSADIDAETEVALAEEEGPEPGTLTDDEE